jgi:hypothetical protein
VVPRLGDIKLEYYKKYEQRHQAFYAAGANKWEHTLDNEILNEYLTRERNDLFGQSPNTIPMDFLPYLWWEN